VKSVHGGNIGQLALEAGIPESELLDFSANMNPLGPPEGLRTVISSQISFLVHYPDPACTALIEAAASHYQVSREEVIAANGTSEILFLLPQVLGKRRAVVPVPAYADYAKAVALHGMAVETIALSEEDDFRLDCDAIGRVLAGDEAVFIARPNNPTGWVCPASDLRRLAVAHPETIFVVDEAFGDFVEDFDSLTKKRPPNVLVLLSLTKIYAIPGLRLGCAVGDASLIQRLRQMQPTWSVNTLAQAVGAAALQDRNYLQNTRQYVREQREWLAAELAALPGLKVYPGEANFLFLQTTTLASELAGQLLGKGIAIRVCRNFAGLDDRFFRVAVRTAEENGRLCAALRGILGGRVVAPRPRGAATIMFQGTSSNAGKSVLTAALCRILHQDGFQVAPFKAQNMSLNSFVTRDGLEMGRAQVVQAQACRIEPDARMNPVLLKPNSDTGSQVILNGKPVGNMNVGEFIRFKPQAFEVAKHAFDSLASENEVVVLEGAGSPAEVNLKRHDITNMRMAQYAQAPVLLVGDIDRGGVFASFVGTMEVLSEWERALVAGFVVNRFRGQQSLLQDALDYTQRHTGRPTLGVVPYLRNLGLPEEDSVSFKQAKSNGVGGGIDRVEIAMIDLPHISNFTDFDSLNIEPDVVLRIVRSAEELGRPDAIILPGSKNVVSDLEHLCRTGLTAAIRGLAREERTEIIGICGGYQMLGEKILDPHGIESVPRTENALGLLPLVTVMEQEKTLRRVAGRHLVSGIQVEGYEIHHGQTQLNAGGNPMVVGDNGEVIGAGNDLVWGSYLHGIFDADSFRRWFIDRLRVRRGLPAVGRNLAIYDLQEAFDRLANTVRESLDMERIYKLLKLR
jgi:cobyric acid synthase CobQ/L-threonine-O-3-phosphate decarboxylase